MQKRALASFKYLQGKELLLAVLVAVAIIGLGVGLGWENNKLIPVNPTPSAHYNLEPHNRLSFMVNWDGPIYLNLARHGYTSKSLTNFFPLYPLCVRIVNKFINSTVYSGVIVAWTCFVGAIYFYLKIVKQLYGLKSNTEALRGALFFVLFPTGVFLVAPYTESLFAFLALGALYFVLRKNYLAAAPFAMLLTATHVNGLFVLVLIGLLMLEQNAKLIKIALTLVAGSLGLAAFMAFQAIKFHNPFAFLAAQKSHSWLNFSPAHIVSEFATLNGLFLVLLVLAAWYWRRRRKSFSVYSLLYVCIVFVGGRGLSGVGRYSLMAFPLELMFYDYFRSKKLGFPLAIALTSVFWAFFTLHYTGGYTGG
jgi:hypothetical protein